MRKILKSKSINYWGEFMVVIKKFGKDFFSNGGALTLRVEEVSKDDPESGYHTRTHKSGWTISGSIHEDYFTWVNCFSATHPVYGLIIGDFENEVKADSEEAFQHFWANHQPESWDYDDI